MKDNKALLWAILAVAVILLISNLAMFGSIAKNRDAIDKKASVTVDFTDQNAKIADLMDSIDNLNKSLADSNEGKFMLTENEYEYQQAEECAIDLALEELNSKDFKKAVFDALENALVDIDSYKDITEIKVMDQDVRVRRETGRVDLDLKVYYFVDGDGDETEKARLEEFTIVVNDLDFEENFEDAEVDEDYLNSIVVEKVYD